MSIVDLPGVSDDFCPMKTFNKNIKNYIVSMAWHPEFEEILAFGTMEGRVSENCIKLRCILKYSIADWNLQFNKANSGYFEAIFRGRGL